MISTKKVQDVMSKGEENPILKEEDLFRTVLELMNEKKWGCVSIINEENELTGIITDGDIRRLILNTQDSLPNLFVKTAGVIMTKNPVTISPNLDLDKALEILEEKRVWVLPVTDENKHPVGLLHMQEALKSMLNK